MTLGRARVIKAYSTAPGADALRDPSIHGARPPMARRIPAAVIDAKAEAGRIVEAARGSAAEVASEAAKEAREREVARVAAELVALRITEEARATREIDRTIAIATLLAERIVGEALVLDPARIGALAVEALKETRGARKIRIESSPADVDALERILAELAPTVGASVIAVEPNAELARGSLVVHTELGRVDARLEPQLGRLAEALRETMMAEQRR